MNIDMGEISGDAPLDELAALRAENARLKKRISALEELASHDTLTPLFNRRHFCEVLQRRSWRAHRYGGDHALIYLDVDDLKSINDNYGHLAGDRLLKAVAQCILSIVRRSDVAARLGGDEFALLLDNVDGEQAQAKAEQIARAVGDLRLEIEGNAIAPSVAFGWCSIKPGADAEMILAEADARMYASKKGG